mmetsp:Transcript_33414/g.66261  ORF Transcript_33414/g.66261 Transcript_33414/m.66261 type:complete len:114 (-) Transcript_33414:138-479(-)
MVLRLRGGAPEKKDRDQRATGEWQNSRGNLNRKRQKPDGEDEGFSQDHETVTPPARLEFGAGIRLQTPSKLFSFAEKLMVSLAVRVEDKLSAWGSRAFALIYFRGLRSRWRLS